MPSYVLDQGEDGRPFARAPQPGERADFALEVAPPDAMAAPPFTVSRRPMPRLPEINYAAMAAEDERAFAALDAAARGMMAEEPVRKATRTRFEREFLV